MSDNIQFLWDLAKSAKPADVPNVPEFADVPQPNDNIGLKAYAERQARAAGAPVGLFDALINSESSRNPNAVNTVGGVTYKGLAQFAPATAAQYGINPENGRESINGALAYLKDIIKRQGGDITQESAWLNAIYEYKGYRAKNSQGGADITDAEKNKVILRLKRAGWNPGSDGSVSIGAFGDVSVASESDNKLLDWLKEKGISVVVGALGAFIVAVSLFKLIK